MNKEQANLCLRFDDYNKPRSTINRDSRAILNLDKDPDHVGIKVETADYCFNLISFYSPSNMLRKETILKYEKYGPMPGYLQAYLSQSPNEYHMIH